MSVGVMKDYKRRDLHASHTLGWSWYPLLCAKVYFVFFRYPKMNTYIFLLLAVLAERTSPAPPYTDPSRQGHLRGKARLSEHGPDIAMLHPPDGFLVEDASKFVVAFYVSSFCVARLGDDLQVPRVCIRTLRYAHSASKTSTET
jgi:hypothetical protein